MLRLFEVEELTTNRVQCRARSSIAEVRRKKTIVKGETDYWLEVIQSAGYFSDEEYASLDADNKELTTKARARSARDRRMQEER